MSKPAQQVTSLVDERPKSRKERRQEKKAARKAAIPKSNDEIEALKKKEAILKRKERDKHALRERLREERAYKKLKKKRQQNRTANGAPKRTKITTSTTETDEQDITARLVQEIRYGKQSDDGRTTLTNGVQFRDLQIGFDGPIVHPNSLVTVKYRLRPRDASTVIDSNNKFTFRVGKGEVIVGFDQGVQGMRVGGRRVIFVPPKTGYGAQDIGAGAGAVLRFDVSVLAVR